MLRWYGLEQPGVPAETVLDDLMDRIGLTYNRLALPWDADMDWAINDAQASTIMQLVYTRAYTFAHRFHPLTIIILYDQLWSVGRDDSNTSTKAAMDRMQLRYAHYEGSHSNVLEYRGSSLRTVAIRAAQDLSDSAKAIPRFFKGRYRQALLHVLAIRHVRGHASRHRLPSQHLEDVSI